MAKSRTKEIAREKTPQERVKDSYSYEKACNAAKNSGTPTYHFAVGDRVQVGHLPNCVVEEVMDDGAMYLIRVTTKNNVEYSCWAWTSVRPLDDDKDTHFAKRDSALSRLHYSNRSMYSLLSFHYLFGVDFKPDYQRGSVWDEEDREKLLDSIFAGREIGRFVFKQLPFNRTNDDGNYYEIVDGKQRMLTLLAFYENRFPYKGAFYNDLSALDKNWFMDASIGVAELDQNTTRAEVLEVFLALNEGGKPVAKEVLDHARELLKRTLAKTGEYAILPIYIYEHSGIALCTVPFSDIWDSACIGFAVANINNFMKQRISDTPVSRCEAMHRAEDCIRNELEAYSDYLAGNCWQYCITDEDGNVVDSCSGFIGDDLEKNGILNYICDYIEK